MRDESAFKQVQIVTVTHWGYILNAIPDSPRSHTSAFDDV